MQTIPKQAQRIRVDTKRNEKQLNKHQGINTETEWWHGKTGIFSMYSKNDTGTNKQNQNRMV